MQHVTIERDFRPAARARLRVPVRAREPRAGLFGSKIRRLRDGTDGTRNGVGSERELKVGPLPPFVETVTEVGSRSAFIRYRITKGSPLRDHEGVMEFWPRAPGRTCAT